jgi:multidrug efflux pump subunit AcrA (membrane-fusion protein)
VKRPLYRKEALERLASPEQLDQLLQLTRPRGWLALGGLGLLLLFGLCWSIFGTIATTVEAQGMLVRRGGVRRVDAPAAGTVRRYLIAVGQTVRKGQKLAEFATDSPLAKEVLSPCDGRVLEVRTDEGGRAEKGEPLLLLDPEDQPLRALLYVPVAEGYQIEPGMQVLVAAAPARKSEFGYLVGEVAVAARFPTSLAEMARHLGSEDLARQLAAAGPCLEVVVDLHADPETPSGYRWSSAQGWPHPLHSGTPCQASVTVGRQRPLALALPSLGDLLGS